MFSRMKRISSLEVLLNPAKPVEGDERAALQRAHEQIEARLAR